jgi:type IV pilus assembly protein PilE
MKLQQGFSLIELMVTIVIVSILASIAIPSYRDYVVRGRIPEATAALGDIRVRMEQFFQDNQSYPTGGCATAPTLPTATQISVPAGSSFAFSCATTATTYTITATGGSGMSGFQYTIDQFNNRASNFSGTAATQGWTSHSPNNCWVNKKGGGC